jgi:hypothetical protein
MMSLIESECQCVSGSSTPHSAAMLDVSRGPAHEHELELGAHELGAPPRSPSASAAPSAGQACKRVCERVCVDVRDCCMQAPPCCMHASTHIGHHAATSAWPPPPPPPLVPRSFLVRDQGRGVAVHARVAVGAEALIAQGGLLRVASRGRLDGPASAITHTVAYTAPALARSLKRPRENPTRVFGRLRQPKKPGAPAQQGQ